MIPIDTTAKPKTGPEDFFIQDSQNEGIEVPLFRPDGTKSEHWLRLRGHFSDEFQKARRALFASAKGEGQKKRNQQQLDELVDNKRIELTAALVKDWSFDMPCTKENVIDFLKKAPQIAALVDTLAGDQSLFMSRSGKSSKSGLSSKSNSKHQSKVRHTRSKRT